MDVNQGQKDPQKEIEEFSILVGRLLRKTISKQYFTITLLALVQILILGVIAWGLHDSKAAVVQEESNRSISVHNDRCIDIGLFKQIKVKDIGVMRCKYYQMIGHVEQYYTVCIRRNKYGKLRDSNRTS